MDGTSERMSAEEMGEWVKDKLAEADRRKEELATVFEMPDSEQLARYLAAHMPGASGVRVENFDSISYGTAREHYSFDAAWVEHGREVSKSFVLLRDHDLPPSVLPHYNVMADPLTFWVQGKGDRQREFRILKCLESTAVAAPRAWFLEESGEWLERSFTIHERVAGQVIPSFTLLGVEASAKRQAIAKQFVDSLAVIHAVDWKAGGLAALGVPEVGSRAYADLMTACLERRVNVSVPQPQSELRPALDWMRGHTPGLQTVALCHGDYKTDNFLFEGEEITAILDWEFAHLGDPAEDLGAVCMGLHAVGDLAMGLLPRQEFLAAYEAAAGSSVERERVLFWEIFYDVRMVSFCYTMAAGAKEFVEMAPELPLGVELADMEAFIMSMVNRILDDLRQRLA